MNGTSTLYAHLAGVCSDPPTLALECRDGSPLSASTTAEVVAELVREDLVGRDVGLHGLATWRLDDWAIVAFCVAEVSPYRPHLTDLVGTFEALAVASGGRWDGVDGAEYVRRLRQDD